MKTKLIALPILLGIVIVSGFFTAPTPAAALTCNSATLTGIVITGTPPATAWFEYSHNYTKVASGAGNRTQVQTFYNQGNFPIEQFVSGFNENTKIYYRLVVMNNYGIAHAEPIADFTTPPCNNPPPVQAPTVNLTANPTSITAGQSSTLQWNSQNATSCSAYWTQSNATNGSGVVSPNVTTIYSITCVGTNGQQVSASATVYVNQPPQTCQDRSASNYGQPGACIYKCMDYNAINYGQVGACKYPPPPPVTCQDPSATNYHTGYPCQYPPQTCQDPNAINYHTGYPCQYPPATPYPTVNLTANPTTITAGQNSTLTWHSQNATSCSAYWTQSTATNGSGVVVPNVTTTYSITCTNSRGSASDTATVTVQQVLTCQIPGAINIGGPLPCIFPSAQPTVTLTADDTSIDEGDSTTLRWSSANATSCNGTGGSNGWAGTKSVAPGNFNTGSLSSDKTYTITCTNGTGSATDSVTVRVNDDEDDDEGPDVATRNATNVDTDSATLNGRVDGNGSSVRAWFEYGTSRSNLNRDTSSRSYGSGSTNFDQSIYGLSANTTYYFRAVAENSHDEVKGSILSFNTRGDFITPVNNQPTVVIYADSTNLAFNGATNVRWSTTNATSCFASGGSIGWAGAKSIGPGSFFTGSLTSTRTYSITCTNNVGSSSDSVTVSVRPRTITTTTTTTPRTSLVLVTSTVDRNQPIVPTLDNTNPCPGDDINYTITYQNIGTGSVTNLALRVDLPFEVQYISSNPNNPIVSGQTLIFNLGTLRANGQGTVTVRVHVRENAVSGSNLNFPATLSYIDPTGFPQSVAANVSAGVCVPPLVPQEVLGTSDVSLGASVFGAGFLPSNIFGWLLLLILILILVLLARYIFMDQAARRQTVTTYGGPNGHVATERTTTTTGQL